MNLKKFFPIVFLFLASFGYSQNAGRVLVQNSKNNSSKNAHIEIKWYSKLLTYERGVNIYRKSDKDTSWVKMNQLPILKQKFVPATLLAEDSDLDALLNLASDKPALQDNGFLLLTLFAKSFQSQIFSTLLGIQFIDKTVQWGVRYQYRVAEINIGGEADLGVSSEIKVGVYQPQLPPEKFEVTLEKGVALMNWREEENRFYGVNIYGRSAADSNWRKLNPKPIIQSFTEGAPERTSMFQQKNLVEGVSYQYRIKGLDFFGEETLPSNIESILITDLTPPPPPTEITKSVKGLVVSLSWKASSAPDHVGYYIYRSELSDGPFSKVSNAMLPAESKSYLDNTPHAGYYYYYVAAVDENGNEASSENILVEAQDIVPPAAPTHVSAKEDTGRVILTWANNKEPDLKGYIIYRSIEDGKSFVLANAEPISDSTFTQIFPVNVSNTLLFKIVAVDSSFNRSVPSQIVSVILPDVTSPQKPSLKKVSVAKDSITASWFANPEEDVNEYNLYYYQNGSEIKKINSEIIDASNTSYKGIFSDVGKYFVVIEAVDKAGNASIFSDPFSIEKINQTIIYISQFEGKYNKRKKAIALSWQSSAQPQGFTVFRKTIEANWIPISGLVNSASYEDRDVSIKNRYVYQVRAYASSGEIVRSEEVSVNTR
jgi:uncharacterized protein